MLIKKGAMFGLDARIALAIFGALSVVSGAALYSAIKEARLTAVITEFNEYGKAFEQYMLDVGEEPGLTPFHYHTEDLVNSTQTGWNGPYFSYNKIINNLVLEVNSSVFGKVSFLYEKLANKKWNTNNDWAVEKCVNTVGEPCYVWIRYEFNEKYLPFVLELEDKIDETADRNDGQFRYIHFTTPKVISIFYRYNLAMVQD